MSDKLKFELLKFFIMSPFLVTSVFLLGWKAFVGVSLCLFANNCLDRIKMGEKWYLPYIPKEGGDL